MANNGYRLPPLYVPPQQQQPQQPPPQQGWQQQAPPPYQQATAPPLQQQHPQQQQWGQQQQPYQQRPQSQTFAQTPQAQQPPQQQQFYQNPPAHPTGTPAPPPPFPPRPAQYTNQPAYGHQHQAQQPPPAQYPPAGYQPGTNNYNPQGYGPGTNPTSPVVQQGASWGSGPSYGKPTGTQAPASNSYKIGAGMPPPSQYVPPGVQQPTAPQLSQQQQQGPPQQQFNTSQPPPMSYASTIGTQSHPGTSGYPNQTHPQQHAPVPQNFGVTPAQPAPQIPATQQHSYPNAAPSAPAQTASQAPPPHTFPPAAAPPVQQGAPGQVHQNATSPPIQPAANNTYSQAGTSSNASFMSTPTPPPNNFSPYPPQQQQQIYTSAPGQQPNIDTLVSPQQIQSANQNGQWAPQPPKKTFKYTPPVVHPDYAVGGKFYQPPQQPQPPQVPQQPHQPSTWGQLPPGQQPQQNWQMPAPAFQHQPQPQVPAQQQQPFGQAQVVPPPQHQPQQSTDSKVNPPGTEAYQSPAPAYVKPTASTDPALINIPSTQPPLVQPTANVTTNFASGFGGWESLEAANEKKSKADWEPVTPTTMKANAAVATAPTAPPAAVPTAPPINTATTFSQPFTNDSYVPSPTITPTVSELPGHVEHPKPESYFPPQGGNVDIKPVRPAWVDDQGRVLQSGGEIVLGESSLHKPVNKQEQPAQQLQPPLATPNVVHATPLATPPVVKTATAVQTEPKLPTANTFSLPIWLEPFYTNSITRYIDMTIQEAKANTDQEKMAIYEAFVTSELEARDKKYFLPLPQVEDDIPPISPEISRQDGSSDAHPGKAATAFPAAEVATEIISPLPPVAAVPPQIPQETKPTIPTVQAPPSTHAELDNTVTQAPIQYQHHSQLPPSSRQRNDSLAVIETIPPDRNYSVSPLEETPASPNKVKTVHVSDSQRSTPGGVSLAGSEKQYFPPASQPAASGAFKEKPKETQSKPRTPPTATSPPPAAEKTTSPKPQYQPFRPGARASDRIPKPDPSARDRRSSNSSLSPSSKFRTPGAFTTFQPDADIQQLEKPLPRVRKTSGQYTAFDAAKSDAPKKRVQSMIFDSTPTGLGIGTADLPKRMNTTNSGHSTPVGGRTSRKQSTVEEFGGMGTMGTDSPGTYTSPHPAPFIAPTLIPASVAPQTQKTPARLTFPINSTPLTNKKEVQPIETSVLSIPADFGPIDSLHKTWSTELPTRRQELLKTRRERADEHEEYTDRLYAENQVGYGDLEKLDEDFKEAEKGRVIEEEQAIYDDYVAQVFNPAYNTLQIGIGKLNLSFTSLKTLVAESRAGLDSFKEDEKPLVTDVLPLLLHTAYVLTSFHTRLDHEITLRDAVYKEMTLATTPASARKKLETGHFPQAEAEFIKKARAENLRRAEDLLNVVEDAIVSALEKDLGGVESVADAFAGSPATFPGGQKNAESLIQALVAEAEHLISMHTEAGRRKVVAEVEVQFGPGGGKTGEREDVESEIKAMVAEVEKEGTERARVVREGGDGGVAKFRGTG